MVVPEKKERLSLDVIGQLEEELELDNLNHKKWSQLIDLVIKKDKEEQVRLVFDKYLEVFKFDSKQWSSYINFELNRGDFSKVEALFGRCLPITNDVELCRTYVAYVRRVNDVITGGEKARTTVVLAFDFAVGKVGFDIDSGDLWNDYVDFFKTWTPSSLWEQQQKTDLIRRLYKRCLVIPTARLETLWSEYTKWENEVSTPNSASKFIADLSTSYMEARSWNIEWHHVTKNLLRRKLVPVLAVEDVNDLISEQVELWFKWLEMEQKNALNLKEDVLASRIEYVYKRAVAVLPFVPEVWYRYILFLTSADADGNKTRCIDLLSDGLRLNPRSFMLTFQLSEIYEKDNAFASAQDVYEHLVKVLSLDYALVEAQCSRIKETVASRFKQKNGAATPKKAETDGSDSGSEDEEDRYKVVQYTEGEALEILGLESKLAEMAEAATLVYIKWMALCKRSQGIKEVRNVFRKRNNFKSLGFEFYVQNALIEYYSDNRKVADKIFDLGMKTFSKNGEFLYAHLGFLILTNSLESLKVFFEMASTNLSKEIESDKEALALPNINIVDQKKRSDNLKRNETYLAKIIRRYMKFAHEFLDLDTVLSLEKRYCEYFNEEDKMRLFIDRYKEGKFDGIAKYDLGDKMRDNFEDEDEVPDQTNTTRKRRKIEATDNYSPEAADSSSASNIPQTPQHGFVGNTIYNLLQVLPNAGYFGPTSNHVFSSTKLVELFANLAQLPGEM